MLVTLEHLRVAAVLALRREGKAMAHLFGKLDHPNIVKVEAINLDQRPFWLAYEHLEGGSLEDVIRAFGGPPDVDHALRWLRPIVEGIAAAHDQGVVHRDLKPANIMLDANETLKVCDFGLAGLSGDEPDDHVLGSLQTMASLAGAGTPIYMSPEQRGRDAPDPADDVYALGVILFQLLVGSATAAPDYPRLTLERTGGVPAPLVDLVCDCLTLPRGERPADGRDLLRQLTEATRPGRVRGEQGGRVSYRPLSDDPGSAKAVLVSGHADKENSASHQLGSSDETRGGDLARTIHGGGPSWLLGRARSWHLGRCVLLLDRTDGFGERPL